MTKPPDITRRVFLKRTGGSVAWSLTTGAGLATPAPAAGAATRASTTKALNRQEARTLLAVARTLFPHDLLADDYYVKVVAAIDGKALADAGTLAMLRRGLATLGTKFVLLPESEREKTLRPLEGSQFFILVRSETLNNLYGNPEVWKIFGYEGSSVEHGGYLHRGFDDIDWLPSDQAETRDGKI